MVKLFRYTDKIGGTERGICYSDKNGNPAINNPNWNCEEIEEKDKQYYIDKQREEKEPSISEKDRLLNILGITETQWNKIKKLVQ